MWINRCIVPAHRVDKEADEEVLGRSKPRKLPGWIWPSSASAGMGTASALARQALTEALPIRWNRVGRRARQLHPGQSGDLTGHPQEAIAGFQKTLATARAAADGLSHIIWAGCWI